MSKYRLGWLFVIALSFTTFAFGQSIDSGLPSTQIGSNVSSRPNVQDPAGESVTAAPQSLVEATIPSVQVNGEVTANPEATLESETARSGSSSAANHLLSSIAGWSAGQQKLDHGIQTPRPSDWFNHPMRLRSLMKSEMPGAMPAENGEQPTSGNDRSRDVGEYRLPPPAGSYEAFDADSSDFQDSTRGTAFASSPDPGTQSPLAWSPGLNVQLRDMQTSQFLNPSLLVQRRHHRRRSLVKKYSLNAVPGEQSIFDHDLNSESEQQLHDTLNPPALSPLSSLDRDLNQNGQE